MTTAASLFQRNKQMYIGEEGKLESIIGDDTFLQTFQAWLDTTIGQLDYQYERCEQQLSELQQQVAVQGGTYWCSKTIIEHCNLYMSEKRLVRREHSKNGRNNGAHSPVAANKDPYGSIIGSGGGDEVHAELPDLIRLISCLQQIKEHSYMTPKQRRCIEDCEGKLRTVLFEPRDFLFITNALQTKLRDDGNTRGVFGDLTAFQNSIEELSPDIDHCEQLLEAAIANGEMGLAEDISQRQLDIYQHIITLITDQYPIIANYYSESRNSDRRRRWAIFRMADKDMTAVIESKFRQVEACEEDMGKITQQIKNYSGDDAEQRRRYEADCTDSDRYLQQNKEKQQGVWNRVFGVFQELQSCQSELASLGKQRKKEVDRRLQVEEREAGRRSGHDAFLRAAEEHSRHLQETVDNAHAAKDVAQALNDVVLDGCDSIAAKYDKQQAALSEMLRLVQRHHFKRYSDYYIAASRYLYRKEHRLEQIESEMDGNDMHRELRAESLDPNAKRYAEANTHLALKRREVAQEVLHIRHRLERAEKAIEPTLRSLDFAGIDYVHPRAIVAEMNLNRWSTILSYKEVMNPSRTSVARLLAEERATLERLRTVMDSAGVLGGGAGAARRAVGSAAAASAAGTAAPVYRKDMTVLEKKVQDLKAKPLLPPLHKNHQQQAATAADTSSSAANNSNYKSSSSAAAAISATYAGIGTGGGGSIGLKLGATDGSPRGAALAAVNATYPGVGGGGTASSAAASSSPAVVPKRMEGTTFSALYGYKARAPDELSFEAGDRIVCVSRAPEEGWFRGVCEQRTGLFPINYVGPAQH